MFAVDSWDNCQKGVLWPSQWGMNPLVNGFSPDMDCTRVERRPLPVPQALRIIAGS